MTLYVCGQKISNKSKITLRSGATYTVVGDPQEDSLRTGEWVLRLHDLAGRTSEWYLEWNHRGCWRLREWRYITVSEDFDAVSATEGDYIPPAPTCYCQTFLYGHNKGCQYKQWCSERRLEEGRTWFEV